MSEKLYQIIPEDVAVRMVEAINLGRAMEEKHAPHLLDEFDFTLTRYKTTAMSARMKAENIPGIHQAFQEGSNNG